MTHLDLDSVPEPLRDLIAGLAPGESVTIVNNQRPVAILSTAPTSRPKFGSCAGMLTVHAEDDDHLEDFAEHLP